MLRSNGTTDGIDATLENSSTGSNAYMVEFPDLRRWNAVTTDTTTRSKLFGVFDVVTPSALLTSYRPSIVSDSGDDFDLNFVEDSS